MHSHYCSSQAEETLYDIGSDLVCSSHTAELMDRLSAVQSRQCRSRVFVVEKKAKRTLLHVSGHALRFVCTHILSAANPATTSFVLTEAHRFHAQPNTLRRRCKGFGIFNRLFTGS